MKTSLHSFCKSYQLPKTSVSRRAKALGIDTSNGLSEVDVIRLKKEFNVSETVSEPSKEAIDAELVDDALEPSKPVSNPLDSYSAMELYKPASISVTNRAETVANGMEALSLASDAFKSEQNQLFQHLLNNAVQEGSQMGLMLAQAKISAAMKVQSQSELDFVKKQVGNA